MLLSIELPARVRHLTWGGRLRLLEHLTRSKMPFERLSSLVALSLLVAWMMLETASRAFANGIDLPTREAGQGEEVHVTGHAWLTCCPSGTPVEHVKLFLVEGSWPNEVRMLLFDVSATPEGDITTAFTVPYVEPGRYRLEACGGMPGQEACLPEGPFTVLVGQAPRNGADAWVWGLPAFVLLVVGLGALLLQRGHRPRVRWPGRL